MGMTEKENRSGYQKYRHYRHYRHKLIPIEALAGEKV
jgi:hypothetical protein